MWLIQYLAPMTVYLPTDKPLKTNLLHQARKDGSEMVKAAALHQATNTSSTDQKHSEREECLSLRLDSSPTDSARRKDPNYTNMPLHTTHAITYHTRSGTFHCIHLYNGGILSYAVHGRTLTVHLSISSSSSSSTTWPPLVGGGSCPGICPAFSMASSCCTSSRDRAPAMASCGVKYIHSNLALKYRPGGGLVTLILAISWGEGPLGCGGGIGSPGLNLQTTDSVRHHHHHIRMSFLNTF